MKLSMAIFHHITLLPTFLLIIFCNMIHVHSRGPVYRPPFVERLTDQFSRLSVNQSCNVFFGGPKVHVTNNGTRVDLSLDKSSGSGMVSKKKYYHGFFNAAIKLPAGFTSGVVVAYYVSNAEVFPDKHDEIDIELLGHEKTRQWVVQTNMYGNGSVRTGREEKYHLWFDPTQAFHDYSILWNNHHIVFLIDNVPVREVLHNAATAAVYPSKPMSVYATIWDGSQWATRGGKYPVNYRYAPFVASMGGIQMEGCVVVNGKDVCSRSSLSSLDPVEGGQFAKLSNQQITGLDWARKKHMFYSYCQDTSRYKLLPPECNANN